MKEILQKNVLDETPQYSLKTQKSFFEHQKAENLYLLNEIKKKEILKSSKDLVSSKIKWAAQFELPIPPYLRVIRHPMTLTVACQNS